MFVVVRKNPTLSYPILLFIAELFGLLSVILISLIYSKDIYYTYSYNWTTNPFSYHPLMMTVGLLFCYGNAIILYRTFKETPKLAVKIFHASFLILSLIFGIVGLTAIIQSKNLLNRLHFMSFHSWLGLTTIILFVFQWICGFICFLFPKLNLDIRSAYMPTHRLWGKTIFLCAAISVLTGISEHGINSSFYTPNDIERKRRLIINFFSVFATLFSLIIIYLLSNPEYQRPPDESTDK